MTAKSSQPRVCIFVHPTMAHRYCSNSGEG